MRNFILIFLIGVLLIAACSSEEANPTPRPTRAPLVERTFGTTLPRLCTSLTTQADTTNLSDQPRIAILSQDGKAIHDWHDHLPTTRRATSEAMTEVIACVETPELPTGGFNDPPKARTVQLCEYQLRYAPSGPLNRVFLNLYNYDYTVRLIDVQANAVLFDGDFVYPDELVECPENVQIQEGQSTIYAEIPLAYLVSWVDEQVAALGHTPTDTPTEQAAEPSTEQAAVPTTEQAASENLGLDFEHPVESNASWTPVINEFDGVEMVMVPTGCFMMGRSGSLDGEPVHEQCFEEPFWIDRFEVTNAQFEAFEGTAAQPSRWADPNRPRETVTWFEARDYCIQRGARLPTEAEWEYAARGPDNLAYPWGDSNGTEAVVHAGQQNGETVDVGGLPDGASWVGAHNMGGNVSEWVSSLYAPYPYVGASENNEDTEASRLTRGGNYWMFYQLIPSASRWSMDPNDGYDYDGIRCARDF